MTTDQHRIGQRVAAQLVIADALEKWDARAEADRPDPLAVGAWVLDQLQNHHGWRPPLDPTDVPPLRPATVAAPDVQAAAMAEIRAVLNRPKEPR